MVKAPAPATITCCPGEALRSSDGLAEAAAVSKAPVELGGSAAASVGAPVPRLSAAVANRADRSPPPTTRIIQRFMFRAFTIFGPLRWLHRLRSVWSDASCRRRCLLALRRGEESHLPGTPRNLYT